MRGNTLKFYEWLETARGTLPQGPPIWIIAGLTHLRLRPEPRAMDGPLSGCPVPPDYSAAAGVVDRPAYGSADKTPAAPAPAPRSRNASKLLFRSAAQTTPQSPRT
jgi:hypothetical protein